jgi:hypothetical protein
MMLEEVPPDLLLADFGSSVTAGAVSGLGILDRNSEIIIDGQIVTIREALMVRIDLFGHLQYGDHITVGGVDYIVNHEPIRIADGVFGWIPLDPVVDRGPDAGDSIVTQSGQYFRTGDGTTTFTT